MKAQKRERQAKDKQSIFRVLNGEAIRHPKKATPPAASEPATKIVECPDLNGLGLVPVHQSSLRSSTLLETLQAINGSMGSLNNNISYGSMTSLGNSVTAHSMPLHHSQDVAASHFPMPLNDLYSSRAHIPVQHSHPHQLSHSPTHGGIMEQQLHHFQQIHQMQQMQQYLQYPHSFQQLQQIQFFGIPPPSGNGHM